MLTLEAVHAQQPASSDPLADLALHPDAYRGAVLLSDQIEFYIKQLDPPLLARPDGSRLNDDDLWDERQGCLDTASYKLRLGNEAHVGGVRVRVSDDEPLVLPPHQVAVVKTYETINIPRFLVARWNLRVQWVYEGLLWVGGPQVDPGWQGALYCPIYNLAERQVVIPYKERVFTMDFTRTTPVHDHKASYGYSVKPHKPARQKNLEGHDVNRLRSAPFEELGRLATLENRIDSFIPLIFTVLSVMITAIGVVAALNVGGVAAITKAARGDEGLWALVAVAVVFGLSGLFMSSITMYSRLAPIPRGRGSTTALAIIGAVFLALGAGYTAVWLTAGPPPWSRLVQALVSVIAWTAGILGIVFHFLVWWKATRAAPW